MKHILLAWLVAAVTLTAQPAPGTGTVEGHVFHALTGAPIRKATVVLEFGRVQLEAATDAQGRFQFSALPPGTYRLSAEHSGFLGHSARQPILLGLDGHVTDAVVRLPPQGAISGRILDEDGDPVGVAQVMIYKQVYSEGRRRWDRINIVRTDETGEYRFPKLTPGRYLVRAESDRVLTSSRYGGRGVPDQPRLVYAPTYYPNAPSERMASAVEVGTGADVRGIDIRPLKMPLLPLFRVGGKVTGLRPDSGMTVRIILRAADGAEDGKSVAAGPPGYEFQTTVPQGQYTILAFPPSREVYATGSVTVAGDVTGVVLALSPAPEITGRVSLAGSGSPAILQGVRVTLSPNPSYDSYYPPTLHSGPAGILGPAKAVLPGHYSLEVARSSIPDGSYVQEVKLGGQEVSAGGFEIVASSELELVLSNTAARITGSVSDGGGKPFFDTSVTLIPSDGKSPPANQDSDDEGNFEFGGLRPGTYKLFAWEEVDDSVWQDPEFLKRYESRATTITVGPGETKKAQLRVITVEEMK